MFVERIITIAPSPFFRPPPTSSLSPPARRSLHARSDEPGRSQPHFDERNSRSADFLHLGNATSLPRHARESAHHQEQPILGARESYMSLNAFCGFCILRFLSVGLPASFSPGCFKVQWLLSRLSYLIFFFFLGGHDPERSRRNGALLLLRESVSVWLITSV